MSKGHFDVHQQPRPSYAYDSNLSALAAGNVRITPKPRYPWYLRPFFGLYFGRLVPILGAALTGKYHAYRYLPASLGPLPDADQLSEIMRGVGLQDVFYQRLGFGAVAVHVGTRRPG